MLSYDYDVNMYCPPTGCSVCDRTSRRHHHRSGGPNCPCDHHIQRGLNLCFCKHHRYSRNGQTYRFRRPHRGRMSHHAPERYRCHQGVVQSTTIPWERHQWAEKPIARMKCRCGRKTLNFLPSADPFGKLPMTQGIKNREIELSGKISPHPVIYPAILRRYIYVYSRRDHGSFLRSES